MGGKGRDDDKCRSVDFYCERKICLEDIRNQDVGTLDVYARFGIVGFAMKASCKVGTFFFCLGLVNEWAAFVSGASKDLIGRNLA